MRWLIRKGRYQEAKNQIDKIASVNQKDIPAETIDQVIENCKMDEKSKSTGKNLSIFNIFTQKHLLKISLIVFFLWFVNSGTYYGLALHASNLGGNPYLNFMISAAVEIPAFVIKLITLNNPKIGRR